MQKALIGMTKRVTPREEPQVAGTHVTFTTSFQKNSRDAHPLIQPIGNFPSLYTFVIASTATGPACVSLVPSNTMLCVPAVQPQVTRRTEDTRQCCKGTGEAIICCRLVQWEVFSVTAQAYIMPAMLKAAKTRKKPPLTKPRVLSEM